MMPRERLTEKEAHVASFVGQGLTHREFGKFMGTMELLIQNQVRTTIDKLGV